MANFIDNTQQEQSVQGGLLTHESPRLYLDSPTLPRRAEDRSAGFYMQFRRFVDVSVALLALTCFGLLLPFIALAILIDSPGPIFYSQTRIGLDRRNRGGEFGGDERRRVIYPGRPFRIYKLRSMRTDAEKNGPQLAATGDARVTRVGRFLRLTRLDEVPQFINVLRGEMALIGPRPERLCFVRQYESEVPGYLERLRVQPGITGLAQVNNGYDEDLASVRRKLLYDRHYIRNCGWRLDLNILLSTVRVVLTGHGAR
jgi:lipopolysaccharide/colanic/teichoic acid biosynthesis glycosyltransferase